MTMPRSIRLTLPALALLSACSMDIVPIPKTQLNSIRLAEKPLLRGPSAPGAFKQSWNFSAGPKGYLLDPTEIAIDGNSARLKPATQVPVQAREAVLVAKYGFAFSALDRFEATMEIAGPGKIVFQLSPDSATWYFHNGSRWTPAGPSAARANTTEELNRHIGNFHLEAAPGSLYFKAFFVAPTGKESLTLKSIDVQGILPRTDGWD